MKGNCLRIALHKFNGISILKKMCYIFTAIILIISANWKKNVWNGVIKGRCLKIEILVLFWYKGIVRKEVEPACVYHWAR